MRICPFLIALYTGYNLLKKAILGAVTFQVPWDFLSLNQAALVSELDCLNIVGKE